MEAFFVCIRGSCLLYSGVHGTEGVGGTGHLSGVGQATNLALGQSPSGPPSGGNNPTASPRPSILRKRTNDG